MIINNIDFLHRVILSMAEEQYRVEVQMDQLENILIGKNLDWETKEDWMSDYITSHFNNVKISLLNKQDFDIDNILNYKNTIALRLYSLEVGESFDLDNFHQITRFPAGWCVKSNAGKDMIFVPFNEEFSPGKGILAKEFEKIINDN